MHTLLHSVTPALQQDTTLPCLYQRLLETQGQVWVSLSGITVPFSWALVHRSFCLHPPRVCVPRLCRFWQLYREVNGNLLQEGLCLTQVYCTQNLCSWSSPLLTHTSAGDTQTQFWLSLCGVSGSWCTQGMFEPSEHLWQVWGLILNAISPLLPFCCMLQHHAATAPAPRSFVLHTCLCLMSVVI